MDLGIKGKTAIVCASSKGLGFGCAKALAQAGVSLIICSRGEVDLLKANQTNLKNESIYNICKNSRNCWCKPPVFIFLSNYLKYIYRVEIV